MAIAKSTRDLDASIVVTVEKTKRHKWLDEQISARSDVWRDGHTSVAVVSTELP